MTSSPRSLLQLMGSYKHNHNTRKMLNGQSEVEIKYSRGSEMRKIRIRKGFMEETTFQFIIEEER